MTTPSREKFESVGITVGDVHLFEVTSSISSSLSEELISIEVCYNKIFHQSLFIRIFNYHRITFYFSLYGNLDTIWNYSHRRHKRAFAPKLQQKIHKMSQIALTG